MKITVKETVIFGMLGALMFVTKLIMEMAPNIHLLGVFIVAYTVVYRKKALYPIYTYVFLDGIFKGFSMWWLPYLYIWTILWGMVMLLPKKMPKIVKSIVYMLVSACHGFLFGTLYAPMQAILFGMNFKATIAWIIAGMPMDIIHGISNLLCGILIVPLITVLQKLENENNY